MAGSVVTFFNLYHWGFCNLTLARDEKGAARVKTAPGWHIEWAGWFPGDNLPLPEPVGRVRGGDDTN